MSYVPRFLATLTVALAVATTLAPNAVSDPDVDAESAAAVIQQLKEQGYHVEVKGVSSDDTSLLTGCTVTAIHKSGDPTPDPSTTTTAYVEVACPIQHS
jgi:uncharacterized membrane protein